jgi:hypothetical protein
LNTKEKATLFGLVFGVGLVLAQHACSSQTAIAITTIDGAALQIDSTVVVDDAVPSTETAPDSPAGPEAGPDLPTGSDAVANGSLFYDGFDYGFEPKWMTSESSDGPVTNALDGTNKIVTLDSTLADYTRIRTNLGYPPTYFSEINLTASMKIRIEQPPASTRTVRLDVRQSPATANIFYAVGATVDIKGELTKVSLFKKVDDGNGSYTICELAAGNYFATPIAMGQWRTIKLTISGTSNVRLTAYYEGLPMATYTDDCVSPLTATDGSTVPNGGCLADQMAVGIQVEKGMKASVDDVLVMTP